MTTVMNQPTAEPGAHGVAQARGLFDGPIMRQEMCIRDRSMTLGSWQIYSQH